MQKEDTMNVIQNSALKRTTRALLASAIIAGGVGYGLGQSNILSVTPSHAEAISVEAPAVFSFGDVVEAVSPAVVSVRVEMNTQQVSDRRELRRDFKRNFGFDLPGRGGKHGFRNGPRKRKGFSQGSGFFVSQDGYLVTNNHVIENGAKYTVVLSDGAEHEASLVGTDPRTDLAVLKVDADEKFKYVEFGSDLPRIGDWVVAVGNPFGLGGTVTAGIVSGHSRNIGAGRYDDFIQIDAAVNRGNSGGPAFNLKGEVIGVNTAIFSPSGGNVGIAFSIPAGTASEIVDDLIQNGSVVRGWLGVQIQPVTPEIAESLGIDDVGGAIVSNPQEGSPADEAGIEAGDVITAVDGKEVKGPRQLSRVIAGYAPDTEISVQVLRDGESRDVTVKLGELATEEAALRGGQSDKPRKFARLGIELQGSEDGVVVMDVRPGSRAEERGIRTGDMIRSVNGKEVKSVRELRQGLKEARKMGRKAALLKIERQGQMSFIPVPVRRG
jgi:serine protease Do